MPSVQHVHVHAEHDAMTNDKAAERRSKLVDLRRVDGFATNVDASCGGERAASRGARTATPCCSTTRAPESTDKKSVQHHGVRTCASCDERVGTSAASAGRVSDGGAAHGSGTASRWAAARREIPSGRGVDGSARMRMVKRPQKVPGRSDQEPKSRETPTPLRAYTSGSSPLRAGTNPIQHFFIAHGGRRGPRARCPARATTTAGAAGHTAELYLRRPTPPHEEASVSEVKEQKCEV